MWSESGDVAMMAWLTLIMNVVIALLFFWIFITNRKAVQRIEEIYAYLFQLDTERKEGET